MQNMWLREPRNGATVVFVHGILSNSASCWKQANGCTWPGLLKNEHELEDWGIYVYGYETGIFSGTYSLNDVVDDFKERFFNLDKVAENRRIVFVCHSMGGIAVRKFLVERVNDLLDRNIEVGLFLVASPSLGSSYANWLTPLAGFMGHTQADALRFTQENTWLNGLDKEFQNLKESGRLTMDGKELIEDQFVVFRKFWRKQVVEPFSGARYFGEPYKVPGSDHFSIAKPEDSGAVQHRLLVAFIEKMAGPAGNVTVAPVARALDPQTPLRAGSACANKRIFISYRHVKPDEDLALALERLLIADGCQVFVDRRMLPGTEWAAEIDRQLRAAEFFVVFLSAESIRSDMVRQEIMLAHELKQQGTLRILPIRVDFTGALPYDLGGYLNPLQYAVWQSGQAIEEIALSIRPAIATAAELPHRGQSDQDQDTPAQLLELHDATEGRGAPLPQADPRVLELAMERGTMRCDSPFYVRRSSDDEMERQLNRQGTIIIKGARQMGKSSLLVRAAARARMQGKRVCIIDFQQIDETRLTTLDSLLRYLMNRLARDLKTARKASNDWDELLGAKDNATDFIEDAILDGTDEALIWFLDEADRVFQYPYRNDFFALLRYWTNRHAVAAQWERFNLVVSHSTDPVLWIDDINQSPFNVGHPIRLADFDTAQVAELSRRYALRLNESNLKELYDLLGGQPYLTRQALYVLASTSTDSNELRRSWAMPDGPFGDHLRRFADILNQREALKKAILQILRGKPCEDEQIFQRLYAAGLVAGSFRHEARLRCRLYEDYFRTHL